MENGIKGTNTTLKNYLLDQESFISQMEWTPFNSLFWNTNDSIANLTILLQMAFLFETDLVIKMC